MSGVYGIAAKHNKSYDTWREPTRTDDGDPYIIAAKDNKHYDPWDRILKVEGRELIGARDIQQFDTWDVLGELNGTQLEVGRDLAKQSDLRGGTVIAEIDGEYVKATRNTPEYRNGDRIIKVEAQIPPNDWLGLALATMLSGVLY